MTGLPDLMLLHGLGDNKTSMQPFINVLDGRVNCWAGDLLGHGDRPLPEVFDMDAIAEDILRGMDAAGIERPYLFGHSFGGRVALYVARHFPDRVSGVCSFGSRFSTPAEYVMAMAAYYDPDSDRVRALPQRQQELFRIFHPWISTALERPPHTSEEDLRRIEAPVLVLSGDSDPIVPAEDQQIVHELLPNNRLVLFKGTAHPLHAIPFDLVAHFLVEFIRDVETLGEQMRIA